MLSGDIQNDSNLATIRSFVARNSGPFKIPHKPAVTAQEILRESRLPYLPILGFKVPHQAMLEEALRLEKVAVPHRSQYEEHRGWKSLVIHGISSAHTQGAEHYGLNPEDPSIYEWTDIARLCPVTKFFFQETFNYEFYQRVRFMYLEPGGYILPHRDTETYFLGPTNMALNHPAGCRFVMEDVGEVPFVPGQINKLALVNRHTVFNDSAETRVHIIIHGAPLWEIWAEIFKQSYRALLESSAQAKFVAV